MDFSASAGAQKSGMFGGGRHQRRQTDGSIGVAHGAAHDHPINLGGASAPPTHPGSPTMVANQHPSVSGRWFVDRHGRRVMLRGVNLSGNAKLPATPDLPSYAVNTSADGDEAVSFVGRPLPLDECDSHFEQLRGWGFNVLRLCLTWEAVEHFGPGVYDDEFVDYLVALVRRARAHGLVCFLDPHQDVWSRQCGGSGAPAWTLKLAGLHSPAFYDSGAAITHSAWTERTRQCPSKYPKMIWSTNYQKLAAATMFTLFFGGSVFAPKFTVKDYVKPPGVAGAAADYATHSVQDFLQFHFMQAMLYVARRMHAEGLYEMPAPGTEGFDEAWAPPILGWDSLNEPSQGWIGAPDVNQVAHFQILRNGATPSPMQAMRAGAGIQQRVANYTVAWCGPIPCGTTSIGQNGTSAWTHRASPLSLHERGLALARSLGRRVSVNATPIATMFAPSPPALPAAEPSIALPPALPTCIWAEHGVWDPSRPKDPALKPGYFATHPVHGFTITSEVFVDHFWLPFADNFARTLRSVYAPTLLFLDPPVNEPPPHLVRGRGRSSTGRGAATSRSPSSGGARSVSRGRVASPSPAGNLVHSRQSSASSAATTSVAPLLRARGSRRSASTPPTAENHAPGNAAGAELSPVLGSTAELCDGEEDLVSGEHGPMPDVSEDLSRDLVYAPHWYDGLTLVTKHYWMYNLDFLHVQRGRKNMLTGLRFGYAQVKRGMAAQLQLIKEEGLESIGACPTLIGEIGIPFDMDGTGAPPRKGGCARSLSLGRNRTRTTSAGHEVPSGRAHRAMDANLSAVEGNLLNATLWNYCPENTRNLGDKWNGEDLSVVHMGRPRPARALLRPVPLRVPGDPTHLAFDYRRHILRFAFTQQLARACATCRAGGAAGAWAVRDAIPAVASLADVARQIPAHLLVELYLPRLHFPDAAGARSAVSAGGCVVDSVRQRLLWIVAAPNVLRDATSSASVASKCDPEQLCDDERMCQCCLRREGDDKAVFDLAPWTRVLRLQVTSDLAKDAPEPDEWFVAPTLGDPAKPSDGTDGPKAAAAEDLISNRVVCSWNAAEQAVFDDPRPATALGSLCTAVRGFFGLD